MLGTVVLVAILATHAAAGFNDQQRKNFQAYLDTPFTKAAIEADKSHDKVRRLGLKDDLSAALARLGPSIERSLKTALLFRIGANESDGLPERHPGSMFLPELHQDVETIRAHLGELLKKDKMRRLSVKKPEPFAQLQNPISIGRMNSSEFLARTASPKNRYSVRKLNGETWHHISLAGPVQELNRGGERRLFGDCTSDKVLSVWKTTADITSEVVEEPDAGTACDGDILYEKPPGAASNKYAAKYCETDSGLGTAEYALIGNTCPSYPGFTSDSACSVQKDTLPGGIDCKFELAVMDAFSLTFNFVFAIGYGGGGDSEDLVASASIGMYTSQLPRPCLGVGDTACELMAVLAQAMSTFVDIGGSLAGPAMKGTIDLFPTRFSFPAGYDGTADGTPPKTLFRVPLTSKAAGVGAQTSGISLEEGNLCLSTIGTKVKNLGKFAPALKLLGFALSLSGSDVCVKSPGVVADAGSLKLGLQVEGYALDKTKVNIEGLWDLFPATFKPLVDGLTDPIELKGLKDLFNAGGDDSLNAKLVQTIVDALPDAKVIISLDVAKLVGEFAPDAGVVVPDGDSYIFQLDNVFATGRRLSPREPHDMVTLDFPPSFFAEQRRLHAERRLQDFSFPVALAPLLKEGSKCHMTITGMPKTLQCDFVLGLSDVIEAKLRANAQLIYDIDGSTMILTAGFGFNLALPEPDGIDQSVKDAVAQLEEILDIGAMIDESMAGGVKMLPTSLSVPPTYNDQWDAVQEVARIKIPALKAGGLCITTMKDLEGVSPGILDLIKTVNKFTGAVGGDACVNSPLLDVADGFKLNMIAGGEVFNKDKVNIWPIVKEIGSLSPDIGLLIQIADAVMTDDILDTINSAAASFMPDMIDITFDIGKALFDSLSDSRRLEATSHNGRRLSLSCYMSSDGTFNLGGFPASAAPGSTAVAGTLADGCDAASVAAEGKATTSGAEKSAATPVAVFMVVVALLQ